MIAASVTVGKFSRCFAVAQAQTFLAAFVVTRSKLDEDSHLEPLGLVSSVLLFTRVQVRLGS